MPLKYKLVFTVPLANADECRKAIARAGAGKYKNYSFCSFSTKGIGRFLPDESAKPFIGKIGKMQQVEEERIECQVDAEVVDSVLAALKKAHPYEEIAYDLYPLELRQ